MRASNLKRLVLILLWQVVMVSAVVYFDASPRPWIPGVFAVAALLPPFLCYIAAVDDAPLFVKWPRILKASVVTLSSVILTVGVYVGLFVAGYAIEGKLGGGGRASAARGHEPNAALEARRRESGAALKAQLNYDDKLIAALDRTARQTTGEQAVVARASAEFLRNQQSILSNYYAAAKPLVQARLLDMADIETTNELEKRKTMVTRFLGANGGVSNYMGKAENDYRTLLLEKGLPESRVDEETKRLRANMEKVGQTSAIFSLNDRVGQSELRALGLLESNWDSWSYDSSLRKTVFKDESLRSDFNRMVSEINTATKERAGVQQKLEQNLQQNPLQ